MAWLSEGVGGEGVGEGAGPVLPRVCGAQVDEGGMYVEVVGEEAEREHVGVAGRVVRVRQVADVQPAVGAEVALVGQDGQEELRGAG